MKQFMAMTLRQKFAWYVVFPIYILAHRYHKKHHWKYWLSCNHLLCRIGKWADEKAHTIAQINYGSWWV